MTVRAAIIGLALAAILALEACAVTTAELLRADGGSPYPSDGWLVRGLPWLVAATLYALAASRIRQKPNDARWLAIIAAILVAPRAATGVTWGIEPAALWLLRPLVCAVAPWLAIVYPFASRSRVAVAAVNVAIEVVAAGLTLAVLVDVARTPGSGMTGLLGLFTVSLVGWPWILAGQILLIVLSIDPRIALDAVVLGVLGVAVVARSAPVRRIA
jgi:hypothetical protein